MSRKFAESDVEQAALAWLESACWSVKNGAEIAPGYAQFVLTECLRSALAPEALDDAFPKLARPEGPTLEARAPSLPSATRCFPSSAPASCRVRDAGKVLADATG